MPLKLDTSGLTCPLPVLRAQKMLRTMQTGDSLELISTDSASWEEVPAFCEQAGHSLTSREKKDGVYSFIIKKG